jgi:hypothetical protein
MMKKTIPYLVVLLAALVALWWWLGKREELRQRTTLPGQTGMADSASVSRFVLERAGQPRMVLARDADGIWRLTEPVNDRANMNLVRQFIQGVSTMKFMVMVSSRTSQFAAFEIDDRQAAHLQAYQGDSLVADLFIGKLSPDGQHVYVRQAGKDEVYTATGGGAMAAMRTRAANDFRDRQIYNFDMAAIDSMDVSGEGVHYRLARVDTVSWRVQIGKGVYQPADPAVSPTVLRALGDLRATNFADDTTSLDWSKPILTVHAWMLGGSTETLRFLKAGDENNYWVKAEGNPHTYKVFQSAYQTFMRDPKTLVAKSS